MTPGAHAIVLLDQAGWHTTEQARNPEEPDAPADTARQPRTQCRREHLAIPAPDLSLEPHVQDYDEIIAACLEAWRRLEAETGRIRSIATRSWASIGQSYEGWYKLWQGA